MKLFTKIASAVSLSFFSASVFAAQTVGDTISNVQEDIFANATTFITGGLFVLGWVFIGSAVFAIRKMGVDQAAGASKDISAKNPILQAAAGFFCLYIAVFAGIGGQTLFGNAGSSSTTSGTTTIVE